MPVESSVVRRQAKVEDIGGVFIYAKDSKSLAEWYQDKMGIELAYSDCDGGNYCALFVHGSGPETVFSIKPAKSVLSIERNQYMINFRIGDFDGFIDRLKSKGVAIDRTLDDPEYGRFGWIKDLEGNPIEFWQPK